jgi:hypothetical protein
MAEGVIEDLSETARGCFGVLVAIMASGLFVFVIIGVGIVSVVRWF